MNVIKKNSQLNWHTGKVQGQIEQRESTRNIFEEIDQAGQEKGDNQSD